MNDPTWTTDEVPARRKAPALWKQILGAVTGAIVAVGLYTGYQWGGGQLSGYLTPPGWRESAVPAHESRREVIAQAQQQQMEHVAEQARKMAELLVKSSSSSSAGSMAPVTGADAASSSSLPSSSSMSSTTSMHSGAGWSAPTDVEHAETLPDSGFPIVGIIGAALGSSAVRFRRKHA